MIESAAALLQKAVRASPVSLKPIRTRAVSLLVVLATLNAAVTFVLAIRSADAPPMLFWDRYFVVDATARLFLLLIDFVFLGVATYVWSRVAAEPTLQEGVEWFVALAVAFIVAANLAVLSNHLLLGWAFLECTTLAAAPLIRFRGGPKALWASWRYFLFSTVGLSLAFLGFACLARSVPGVGEGEVGFFIDGLARTSHHPPDFWRKAGLALIFVGYGTKLGLAPMFTWLPETYEAAPPAVTALLAAVQFNVALVGVFRILQISHAGDQHRIHVELLVLGLATMAVSAIGVMATHNYKRLLAYASLNHGGVIAIGLAIGKSAAYGVVLYVVSNAIIKAVLFLTAGKIRSHYKTGDVREVSGLLKEMPYTGVFFAIGTFALLGLPPAGSFLGELIILSGLVKEGYLGVFAMFCTILTVTFVATGRSIFPMIWGAPPSGTPSEARSSFLSVLPKLALVVFLLAMGLYLPPPINTLFRQVAASLGGE